LGRVGGPRRRRKCEGPGEEIKGCRRRGGPVGPVVGFGGWV